jgi:hypothetical protein
MGHSGEVEGIKARRGGKHDMKTDGGTNSDVGNFFFSVVEECYGIN